MMCWAESRCKNPLPHGKMREQMEKMCGKDLSMRSLCIVKYRQKLKKEPLGLLMLVDLISLLIN